VDASLAIIAVAACLADSADSRGAGLPMSSSGEAAVATIASAHGSLDSEGLGLRGLDVAARLVWREVRLRSTASRSSAAAASPANRPKTRAWTTTLAVIGCPPHRRLPGAA